MAGSHKLVGEFLQRREPAGCSYMRLFWYAHWVYNGIAALGLGRSGRTPMEVVQAAPCRAVSERALQRTLLGCLREHVLTG